MKKSHELLARYLEGDLSITLNKIKETEKQEYFEYCLDKASFGKDYLKILAFPFVFIYCLLKED